MRKTSGRPVYLDQIDRSAAQHGRVTDDDHPGVLERLAVPADGTAGVAPDVRLAVEGVAAVGGPAEQRVQAGTEGVVVGAGEGVGAGGRGGEHLVLGRHRSLPP
jgi:hypothetical protein